MAFVRALGYLIVGFISTYVLGHMAAPFLAAFGPQLMLGGSLR